MPRIEAQIKRTPEDFQVTELLQPELSEAGEHAWLWVEKSGANTEWVARQLARFAGIPVRDVGYSGLKDRHAVTQQWFSVCAPASADWSGFDVDGVRILEQHRHARKLKRGTHKANRFRVALRGVEVNEHRAHLESRIDEISRLGVPNFFGEQRYGRGGSNLALADAWCAGQRLSRHRRGIAISAARSRIFDAILERRVREGTWDRIVAGERANLDGSASTFAVDAPDGTLQDRCARFDIHPTGTMWGTGAPLCGGGLARLERAVADEFARLADGLQGAGVEAASRALRLRVADLAWEFGDDVLWLSFGLAKGGYATTVIDRALAL